MLQQTAESEGADNKDGIIHILGKQKFGPTPGERAFNPRGFWSRGNAKSSNVRKAPVGRGKTRDLAGLETMPKSYHITRSLLPKKGAVPHKGTSPPRFFPTSFLPKKKTSPDFRITSHVFRRRMCPSISLWKGATVPRGWGGLCGRRESVKHESRGEPTPPSAGKYGGGGHRRN